MKRSKFDEARDQRIADEAPKGYTPEQMCAANGCPNRWSVDAGSGKLCSAHACEDDTNCWPDITQQQQWNETDRAQMCGASNVEPLSAADKRAVVAKLGALAQRTRETTPDPLAWARRLHAREKAGERLNLHQRDAWRGALRTEQRARAMNAEPPLAHAPQASVASA